MMKLLSLGEQPKMLHGQMMRFLKCAPPSSAIGLARPRLGRRPWMMFSQLNLQASVQSPHWTNGMSGYT
jgi:hypothetical protein